MFAPGEIHSAANEDRGPACEAFDTMNSGWCRSHTGFGAKQRSVYADGRSGERNAKRVFSYPVKRTVAQMEITVPGVWAWAQ